MSDSRFTFSCFWNSEISIAFILALNVAAEKPESGQIFPLCVVLLFLLRCVRISLLTLKLCNLIRM